MMSKIKKLRKVARYPPESLYTYPLLKLQISGHLLVSPSSTDFRVQTQPYVTALVIGAFEEAVERKIISEDDVTEEILIGFLGSHGREFYGIVDSSKERIVLRKGTEIVEGSFTGKGVEIVPFRRGQGTWSIEWK